ASLYLAAVGVEDTHLEIGLLGWLEQDQLVAADAVPPVGDRMRARCRHLDGACPRINDDKVVAEAMHLGEAIRHVRACKGAQAGSLARRGWLASSSFPTPGATRLCRFAQLGAFVSGSLRGRQRCPQETALGEHMGGIRSRHRAAIMPALTLRAAEPCELGRGCGILDPLGCDRHAKAFAKPYDCNDNRLRIGASAHRRDEALVDLDPVER